MEAPNPFSALAEAYNAGDLAYSEGRYLLSNPCETLSPPWEAWREGWLAAHRAAGTDNIQA